MGHLESGLKKSAILCLEPGGENKDLSFLDLSSGLLLFRLG